MDIITGIAGPTNCMPKHMSAASVHHKVEVGTRPMPTKPATPKRPPPNRAALNPTFCATGLYKNIDTTNKTMPTVVMTPVKNLVAFCSSSSKNLDIR